MEYNLHKNEENLQLPEDFLHYIKQQKPLRNESAAITGHENQHCPNAANSPL